MGKEKNAGKKPRTYREKSLTRWSSSGPLNLRNMSGSNKIITNPDVESQLEDISMK